MPLQTIHYGRFLRIALGSARESKGWSYRGRYVFDDMLLQHRYQLLNKIIAGLTITSQRQRG